MYSISLFSNKATWQNNSVWSQITKFIGHVPMEWGSRGNNEERFAIAAKKVSLMLRPSLCSARCCQTDQFALHYTWLIATAFHHHHQQQQGYHRPPPSNLYSPGIVFWPARASEMWRRANQFVILLAKHNKAFNGLISFRFIARKSPQLSVQSHSLLLLVVDLVGGSLSQSKAGRQADLKSLPSECTRAKFPIIHDSNFQNRCSWSFLSPRRVVASVLVRLI